MKRTGLYGLLVALAIAWGGCSDDDATGNENNNNVTPECGNGIVEPEIGETCDDGTANSDTEPDACRISCQTASCGDGVRDTGEDCDGDDLDGAICADLPPLDHGSLSCNLDCTFDTGECYQCGDGAIDPGEECDGDDLGMVDTEPANCGNVTGKPDGVLACLSDCVYDISECALCGDGLIEGAEECDDASDNSNQPNATCRLNCTIALCGDGIWDDNAPRFEQCDCGTDPMALPTGCNTVNIDNVPNACKSDCTVPYCGDGLVDNAPPWNEMCDEGVNNCSDPLLCTCATNCTLHGCGNGVVEVNEECDCGDNLGSLNPGCTAPNCNSEPECECAVNCAEPGCGNGAIEPYLDGEVCDDGANNCIDDINCNCATNCQFFGCGDGIIEAINNEECDDGSGNCNLAGCTCNTICLNVRCGNGVLEGGEDCDCGDAPSNRPATCTANNCTGPGCQCAPNCSTPGCGNGILEAHLGESCDEGAANCDTAGCTCSSLCRLPWITERAAFTGPTLRAVWVNGSEAIAVGNRDGGTPYILHRDAGGTWTQETYVIPTGPEDLYAVCGFLDGRVFAVGTNNLRLERSPAGIWSEQTFSASPIPPATITGVVCQNTWPNSFYTTDDGRILDVTGSTVFDNSPGPPGNGTPYWGMSFYLVVLWAGDVVGESGDYVIYDQANPVNDWTAAPFATITAHLMDTWADQYDYRFIVGTSGMVRFNDGNGWSTVSAGTSDDLFGVGGFGMNAWAVGDNGTIRHYDGTNWTAETALTVSGTLRDVDSSGSLVLAVGDNGVVIRRP